MAESTKPRREVKRDYARERRLTGSLADPGSIPGASTVLHHNAPFSLRTAGASLNQPLCVRPGRDGLLRTHPPIAELVSKSSLDSMARRRSRLASERR